LLRENDTAGECSYVRSYCELVLVVLSFFVFELRDVILIFLPAVRFRDAATFLFRAAAMTIDATAAPGRRRRHDRGASIVLIYLLAAEKENGAWLRFFCSHTGSGGKQVVRRRGEE